MSKQINLIYPPVFESSNIAQAAFCAEAEMLFIGFVGGGTYAYLDFTADEWANFVEAVSNNESAGRYFHRSVKNRHDYLKLSGGAVVDMWPLKG